MGGIGISPFGGVKGEMGDSVIVGFYLPLSQSGKPTEPYPPAMIYCDWP